MSITAFNTTYCDDVNVPDSNGKTPLDKNYMRILFKPGYAVQTRELNQLQSLIQAQLDRVGQKIFRSGKPVIDGIARFDNTKKIYRIDLQIAKNQINVPSTTDVDVLTSFYNSLFSSFNYVTRNGGSSAITLQANAVKINKTGENNEYVYCAVYVKSANSEVTDNLNVFKYAAGDSVTLSNISDETVTTIVGQVTSVNTAVGAHVAKGVYFVKGSYVIVNEQYVVKDLSEGSLFTGYSVLKVNEGTVDSNTDISLLDNADGALNYNAPGADRYYINLELDLLSDTIPNDENYITLLQIKNDQIVIDNSSISLSGIDDKLAQRTFEESGNYEVNPFPINIREAYNDLTNGGLYLEDDLPDNGYGNADGTPNVEAAEQDLICTLDPSVAYVKGYRIELKSSTALTLPKARTTESVDDAAVSATMGMYVDGEFESGSTLPDITNAQQSYTLTADSVRIGEAKLRSLEYVGGTTYRLFLYDIEMAAGKTIVEETVISAGTFSFTTSSVLKNSDIQTALYKLPLSPIKNIRDLRIIKKQRFQQNATGGSVNLVLTDTSASFDKSPSNILVHVNGIGILSPTDVTVNNSSANVLSLTLTGVSSQLVTVIASVTADASRGVKTLTTETITPVQIEETDTYTLAGVYHLISVPNTYTVISDGQNGVHYSTAIVKPNTGVTVGPIAVTHYKFTSYGDYYDALSYKKIETINSVPTVIQTGLEDIPYYQDTPLHDVLDFRYSFGSPSYSPLDPYEAITFGVEYYLPRIDSVVVSQTGNFSINYGIPAVNPKKPNVPDTAMELYVLTVAPYTFGPNGVLVEKVDNQRYTMSNIRALDRRISNLEYYTTLSLLEKNANDTGIYDADGTDRFKNGFVVDNFSGHNVGDPSNPDYICAIDPENNECRPAFSIVDLKLEVTDSSQLQANDDYDKSGVHDRALTLPYRDVPYITQTYGSDHESVNPYNVSTFVGKLNLYPSSDYWCDTVERPDLVVKDNTLKDAIRNFAEDLEDALAEDGYDVQILGTEWGSWETYWKGKPKFKFVSSSNRPWNATLNTTSYAVQISKEIAQARDGINTSVGTSSSSELDLGERVIDITVRPYIRQRYVYFEAKSLKPNTIYYPFFDGINVSEHCYNRVEIDKQSNVASVNGSPIPLIVPVAGSSVLKSDSNGTILGLFIIPNNESGLRFLTGTRQFKLTDSPKNITSETTSYAAADYVAAGTVKTTQSTILSTAIPELVRTPVEESRTITRQWIIKKNSTCWLDPIAQSFLINNPEGIFATGIDLYFANKSSSGATVEIFIVTCENGIPTQNVVPLSTVIKTSDEVNVNEFGATPTRFEFEQPIYLLPSQEYAVVCVSSDSNYRVYTATLGATDVLTNNIISSNPYNGVFFKSQNSSTWTPDQSKDLKFILHRAEFDVVNPLSVTTSTLSLSRIERIRVINGGSGYSSSAPPSVTIEGNGGATAISEVTDGSVTAIYITNPGNGYTAQPAVTIAPSSGTTATAEAVLMNAQVSSFILDQDSIELSVSDQVNPERVHRSYVTNTINVLDKQYNVEPSITYDSKVKPAWGNDNSVNCNSPITLSTSLYSTSDYLTPVVDIERMNVKLIRNRLMTNVLKTSRYITRRIDLAEAADQIDIYFDVNRPSITSNLNVYVSRDGEDWQMVELEYPTVIPVNSDQNTFSEVHYMISGTDLPFSSFKVKIEFVGSNIVDAPRIKNLRAIATC